MKKNRFEHFLTQFKRLLNPIYSIHEDSTELCIVHLFQKQIK